MGTVKLEDIAGYWAGSVIVCTDCMDKDFNGLEEKDFITTDEIEKNDEVLYFCDTCKKKL